MGQVEPPRVVEGAEFYEWPLDYAPAWLPSQTEPFETLTQTSHDIPFGESPFLRFRFCWIALLPN